MSPKNFHAVDLTAPGADLPYAWLFARLRDLWFSRGSKTTPHRNTDLAKKFGVPAQRISQWATGTDMTRGAPPWHIMVSLAEEMSLEIRIAADGVRLVRRKKLKAA